VLVKLNAVVYCTYILVQVLLYQYTYTITRQPEEKRFSWKHYIFPALILVVTAVWSVFIPDAEKLYSAMYIDSGNTEYLAYHSWINSKYWIRAIISLLYTTLAVWRIMKYKREIVNYSADAERSRSGWLLLSILLTLPLVLNSLVVSLIDPRSILISIFWILPVLLIITQMVVLCYFTITNHYIIIEEIPDDNNMILPKESVVLNKKDFEKYISKKKPYLNPRLKITDMCGSLSTNRTYLSSFINKEYEMNFRQYMNSLRLKEIEGLQIDSGYPEEVKEDILLRAGFGSVRNYLRVKAEMKEKW